MQAKLTTLENNYNQLQSSTGCLFSTEGHKKARKISACYTNQRFSKLPRCLHNCGLLWHF